MKKIYLIASIFFCSTCISMTLQHKESYEELIDQANELWLITDPYNKITQEDTAQQVSLFLKTHPNPEILFIEGSEGTVIRTTLEGYITNPSARARLIPVLQLFITHAGKHISRIEKDPNPTLLDIFFNTNYYFDNDNDEMYQDSVEMDGHNGKIMKFILQSPHFDVKLAKTALTALLQKETSTYVLELMQAALENPNFSSSMLPEDVWAPFLKSLVTKAQNLKIFPLVFRLFKTRYWFPSLPEYPIYKVIGDLMANDKISKVTAQAFLLSDKNKESQTLEQLFLGDEANQKMLKKQKIYKKRLQEVRDIDIQQLIMIQQAYQFAKNYNLTKIGNVINRYMYTLLHMPQNLPKEINKTIMSFDLAHIPKEKRKIEKVTKPRAPKAKKKKHSEEE